MKRVVVATLCAAALLFTLPALAQQAPDAAKKTQSQPAQTPTPETLKLARELVALSGADRTFDEILPNVAESAKNSFIRANPQMQLGIIKVVDDVALEMVDQRPKLDEALEKIWATAFTKEQLQDLIAFYTSPTGKRFSAIQPQLIAAQMSTAQNWTATISEEMAKRVTEKLRAQLADEAKALENAAGQAPTAPKK